MHERRATARPAEHGKALINRVILVAIIGLVVGVVSIIGCGMTRCADRARHEKARRDARYILGAIEVYMQRHLGEPPPGSLQVLVEGRYISRFADPWGRPYQLKCPGEHAPHSCDVWSLGKDGKGGASAIGSWMK